MAAAPPTFGDLLRQYRLTAGLTQRELAERARVSLRAISDLERGQRSRPWRDTVQLLAVALQLAAAERAEFEVAARQTPASVPANSATDDSANTSKPRHNLPVSLTSFVGRAHEISEVKRLLADTRLLTLTGWGGCGKTRLALEVAADLADIFVDGIWFADLAALADSTLVPQAVATALGVHEIPGRPLLTTISGYLHGRNVLLLLDNCEHVLDACARLVDTLLHACSQLRILVTSRELLGVAGETAWRVPSLSVPGLQQPATAATIHRCEAGQLFLDRARAVLPSFAVTDQNAWAVAQICQRLDGIPLAIELAAARVRVLTVEQIATRLDDRFRLLVGGSRTALRRHQTLQATIDWSYQLLSEWERLLLRRLSVFSGGWTLEAAEAVCEGVGEGIGRPDARYVSPDPPPVLDLLTALVDKSLVQAEGRGAHERYRFLETIRQYADVKLRSAGETDVVRRKHRDWCLGVAEESMIALEGPDQRSWSDRMADEHDNLRAALTWCAANPAESAALLHLAAVLGKFWRYCGFNREAIEWLDLAVARNEATPSTDRARALMWLGHFEWIGGKLERARPWSEEAVAQARMVGDGRVLATALRMLAGLEESNDRERARHLVEEAVVVSRASGYKRELAFDLHNLANQLVALGSVEGVESLVVESLALARETGDAIMVCEALGLLTWLYNYRGEIGRARTAIEEGLALVRRANVPWMIQYALLWLGDLASVEHDLDGAIDRYREALRVEIDASRGMAAYALGRSAVILTTRGDYRRAAHLFGVTSTMPRTETGDLLPFAKEVAAAREVAIARQALGDNEYAIAFAEGQAMTPEQAIEVALRENCPDPPR
jgi:non-specific serine/threonine protein kinase